MSKMSPDDLDAAYTDLCKNMSAVGEGASSLFLARFALLAMVELADAALVQRLAAQAAEGLDPGRPDAALRTAAPPGT